MNKTYKSAFLSSGNETGVSDAWSEPATSAVLPATRTAVAY